MLSLSSDLLRCLEEPIIGPYFSQIKSVQTFVPFLFKTVLILSSSLHLGIVSNFLLQVFRLESSSNVPISRTHATYPVHLTFFDLVTLLLRVLVDDHCQELRSYCYSLPPLRVVLGAF